MSYSERYVKERLARGTAGRRHLITFEKEHGKVVDFEAFCQYLDSERALTLAKNRAKRENVSTESRLIKNLEDARKFWAEKSLVGELKTFDLV